MRKAILNSIIAMAVILTMLVAAFAQAADSLWLRSFPGRVTTAGESVQQCFDGGFVMTGTRITMGDSNYGIYVIKTDADGDTLWTKVYDSYRPYESLSGFGIRQLPDSGFIICGDSTYFTPFGYSPSGYLMRLDANGDSLWTSSWELPNQEMRFFGIEPTDDKGFIMTGYIVTSNKGVQAIVRKTDSLGSSFGVDDWSVFIGGDTIDVGSCVRVVSSGGYIMSGTSLSRGVTSFDAWLVRISDFYGDTIWTRSYGGSGDDEARSVIETSDGGFLTAGSTRSFGVTSSAAYVVKTDENGDSLWTRMYHNNDGVGYAYLNSVVESPDNSGYVLTGADAFEQLWVFKIDHNGDTVWTSQVHVGLASLGRCVCVTDDGGYIVAGSARYGDIDTPYYPFLIRFTETGQCCGMYTAGYTGNVNCDIEGKRNMADIARLVDRVYVSKEPLCCEENGNVNGDVEAKINLADIGRLIDHVYISKAETAPCD